MGDEPMQIIKKYKFYNYSALLQYSIEMNAKLIEDYSNAHITKQTFVKATCLTEKCVHIVNKRVAQIMDVTGFYCDGCTLNNRNIKQRQSRLANYKLNQRTKPSFDNECLKKLCEENNVILTENYDNVNVTSKTRIKGKCITNDCGGCWDRQFDEMFKHEHVMFLCGTCAQKNIRMRIKETSLQKYGTTNHFTNTEVMEKTMMTNLEKRGVIYAASDPMVKQQIIDTCQMKYGKNNPFEVHEFKEKMKETNLERYGVPYVSQSPIVRAKAEQTNLERYGTKNPMQNADIAEKAFISSMRKKTYVSPNGINFTCQGYESFALNDLIVNMKIDEIFIVTARNKVPDIFYDDENGKKRRHYVDIFITSISLCVEVKSTYTMTCNPEIIFAKQHAAKNKNLMYEIWVYDDNGNLVTVHK